MLCDGLSNVVLHVVYPKSTHIRCPGKIEHAPYPWRGSKVLGAC